MINYNTVSNCISISAQQNSQNSTIIVFLTYTGRRIKKQEDSIDRQMVEYANKLFPLNMAIENYDRWVYAVEIAHDDCPEWIKNISYFIPTLY